jgi:hypothetical protein
MIHVYDKLTKIIQNAPNGTRNRILNREWTCKSVTGMELQHRAVSFFYVDLISNQSTVI